MYHECMSVFVDLLNYMSTKVKKTGDMCLPINYRLETMIFILC